MFILEKPTFLVQPEGVTIGRGQTAKFDCKVTGGKKLAIRWYFKGEIYDQTSNEKGIVVDENNSLIVSNTAVVGSEGVVCAYKDSFGKEKYSIRAPLNVIGK